MQPSPFDGAQRWIQPEWLAAVRSWVRAESSRLGIVIDEPWEQTHVRPWATAIRIPSSIGTIWFKASTESIGYEAAITAYLSDWGRGKTPTVLAHDSGANWLLMLDSGMQLRAHLAAGQNRSLLTDLIDTYCSIQLASVEHTADLVHLGTPDSGVTQIPALFHSLAKFDWMEFDLLMQRVPQIGNRRKVDFEDLVAQLCGELESYGVPDTIQHDDLHDGNVLVRGEQTVVFDWGDSCISHPFASLLVLEGSITRTLGLEPDSSLIMELRDRYLDGWSFPRSRSERDRVCRLAGTVARLTRAAAWARLIPGLEAPFAENSKGYGRAWFEEFVILVDNGAYGAVSD